MPPVSLARYRGSAAAAITLLSIFSVGCDGESENRSPLAVADQIAMDEDTELDVDVLANDSDPDGDPLSLVSVESDGTVTATVVARTVRVAGLPDANGTATIAYRVTDGVSTTDGVLEVEVRPINDAPVADDASVTLLHDTEIALPLVGSDVDDDSLTFEIVGGPESGTVRRDEDGLVYVPNPGFAGQDAIEFVASDGELDSAVAAVAIAVAPGSVPVAESAREQTDEDVPVTLTLKASDADGDPLEYRIVTGPANGSLTGSPPTLVYTPAANFSGTDSFQFAATDPWLESAPATVTIEVQATNDAPVARNSTASTDEDTVLIVVPDAIDPDGDELTFTVARAPKNGTLVGTPPTMQYHPAADFNGADSFTFSVTDGSAEAEAEISIEVRPVNDAPIAARASLETDEDTPVAIQLAGSDIEQSPLSFEIVRQPARGVLVGTAPNLEYVPSLDANGEDSFEFLVSDGELSSDPVTVTVEVRPVGDAPRFSGPTTLDIEEDSSPSFYLDVSDPDGDEVTMTVVEQPANGGLGTRDLAIRYTPVADFFGTDATTLEFRDATGLTTTVTLTFAVEGRPDPLALRPDVAQTDVDTPVVILPLKNDLDPDGEPLRLVSVEALTGTATLEEDEVRYVPAAGFSGTASLVYTVAADGDEPASEVITVGVGGFPTGAPPDAISLSSPGSVGPPVLSANGRFIAFTARPRALPAGTSSQAYVFDRLDSSLELISVNTEGNPASRYATVTAISADGRFVAFSTFADDVVADDTNGTRDLFVRDRHLGITERVSLAHDGSEANASVFSAQSGSMSADGQRFVFYSRAFNLVDEDVNGAMDVFIRDRVRGTTERVSVRADGGEADGDSSHAVISADGSRVAFASAATNLVPDDSNGVLDVFTMDLDSRFVARVSVSSTGRESKSDCRLPALSSTGRFIAFRCESSTVGDEPDFSPTVHVHDAVQGNTRVAVQATFASGRLAVEQPAISGDGRFVAAASVSEVILRDHFAGRTRTIERQVSDRAEVSISGDGEYVGFLDSLPAIDADRNGSADVYVIPNPFL